MPSLSSTFSVSPYQRWTTPTLHPIQLGREVIMRFVGVQAVDRGVAIGANAFTAMLPLLMLYTAISPIGDNRGLADGLIQRFHLHGPSAAALNAALQPAGGTETSTTSAFGIVLLVIAALSFTRTVQRLYENSFGLPMLGYRGTPWGLVWLALLAVPAIVRPWIYNGTDGQLKIALLIALQAFVWIMTPLILCARRLTTAQILPAGLLTTLGMSALSVGSAIWLPHSVETSAAEYGVLGVAFAIVSWLVGAGLTLAGTTIAGAVISEAIYARFKKLPETSEAAA